MRVGLATWTLLISQSVKTQLCSFILSCVRPSRPQCRYCLSVRPPVCPSVPYGLL